MLEPKGNIVAAIRAHVVLALMGLGFTAILAAGNPVKVQTLDGTPIASAEVRCLQPGYEALMTSPDGRVDVQDDCVSIVCSAEGYIPIELEVDLRLTECLLREGAWVQIVIPERACEGNCILKLQSTNSADSGYELSYKDDPPTPEKKISLQAVPPGRWFLVVQRESDSWACKSDLGVLPAGLWPVVVDWREPVDLTGTALDDQLNPAVNVPIGTWRRPHLGLQEVKGAWSCGAPARDLVSGEDGHFELKSIDPGQETLVVAGNWLTTGTMAAAVVKPGVKEPVSLKLGPPAQVKARVLRADEEPSGCRAWLSPHDPGLRWAYGVLGRDPLEAVCSKDGDLIIDNLLPGSYRLRVEPDSGLPMTINTGNIEPGDTVDLGVLQVSGGDAVEVHVFDETGDPVADAEVLAKGDAGLIRKVSGTTNENGVAIVGGLPTRSIIDVEVHADRFYPAYRERLRAEESPIEITLEPGGAVSGQVVNQVGDPVAGAWVRLERAGIIPEGEAERPALPTAHSDDGGQFRFGVLPGPSVRVTAGSEGYGTAEPVLVEVPPETLFSGVELVLQDVTALHGRVLTPDGNPVVGAEVGILRSVYAGAVFEEMVSVRTRTAEDGTFVLPYDPEDPGWVGARAPGFGPVRASSKVLSQGEELALTLTRPARLAVVGSDSEQEVRMVGAYDAQRFGYRAPFSGFGRVLLTDLAPGDASVWLTDDRGRRKSRSSDVTLIAGETTEVTLEEDQTVAEVRVTVDGTPWPSAAILVTHLEGTMPYTTGLTDAQGNARFESLTPGYLIFVAEAGGGRLERRIEIPRGASAHVDLPIRTIALELTVLDEETGEPLPDASCNLSPVPNLASCTDNAGILFYPSSGKEGFHIYATDCGKADDVTSRTGRAYLRIPRLGQYRLTIRHSGYLPLETNLEIREGVQAMAVTLERDPDQSRNRLIVRSESGMTGILMLRSGDRYFYKEEFNGERVFQDLEPGSAELYLRVLGYGSTRRIIDISDRSAEVVVSVHVDQGGRLIVPAAPGETVRPQILDGHGVEWGQVLSWLTDGKVGTPVIESVPEVGRAWVFRDLPAGSYQVTGSDSSVRTVTVEAGMVTFAW